MPGGYKTLQPMISSFEIKGSFLLIPFPLMGLALGFHMHLHPGPFKNTSFWIEREALHCRISFTGLREIHLIIIRVKIGKVSSAQKGCPVQLLQIVGLGVYDLNNMIGPS